jgi:hopene-associated glycosyltransferase HpnB
MLITAGVLSLLIWVYLLLGRGGFWRIHPAAAPGSVSDPVRVAVIIPARNEAEVVGCAVTSLLRQTGNHSVHLFLVDDGSTDSTTQAAREAAQAAGAAERLTIIAGRPLAAGWSGKLWAVEQGVALAHKAVPEADFYLFTDADIEHAPDSLSTLASIAKTGSCDLVSFMVQLHCKTLPEKWLIPAFVFFFFKLYPPAWIADPCRSAAGAAGGCMLIRPAVLERAGGIQAIRQEVIDDCALAARVKRSGGRLWLGSSAASRSIRPYGGLSDIGRMISRSAFNQLRHSTLLLTLSIVGMAVTYLLPPALVIFSSHRAVPAVLGAAAWLLLMLSYVPVLRLYRISLLWTLALPAAAVFYCGATCHSAWKFWSGRGGEWKGRIQDPLAKRSE